jgi:hypothetical protein
MKELPIIMGAESVRATLRKDEIDAIQDGRKSMLLRPSNVQPPRDWEPCGIFPGAGTTCAWRCKFIPNRTMGTLNNKNTMSAKVPFLPNETYWVREAYAKIHTEQDARIFFKVKSIVVKPIQSLSVEEMMQVGTGNFKVEWDSRYFKEGLDYEENPWVWLIRIETTIRGIA